MTAPSTAPSADETPVITLDPTGADHMGEAARLRAAGPVVRVVLPGACAPGRSPPMTWSAGWCGTSG